MTNECSLSNVRNLWQSQPTEPSRISPAELRRKMLSFARTIFWRNLREYSAGALVVAIFGFYEWKFPAMLARVGSGLTIAAVLYVMFQLHRRAAVRSAPADLGLSTCINFHRQTLEHQRDAMRAVWSWYLLPFIPGITVFTIGMTVNQRTAHLVHPVILMMVLTIMAGCLAAVFYVVWKLNQQAADRLQMQIDELNVLGQDQE